MWFTLAQKKKSLYLTPINEIIVSPIRRQTFAIVGEKPFLCETMAVKTNSRNTN
jgi:hypothetical protein